MDDAIKDATVISGIPPLTDKEEVMSWPVDAIVVLNDVRFPKKPV